MSSAFPVLAQPHPCASATSIGALNKYGLIEGRGDDLRVSERALAILHPHTSAEKQAALRSAATEPDLFRELAEKFPGGMPNSELLKNYLLRNKFAPHAVDAAILAYKETIEFVGSLDDGYDSASNVEMAGGKTMRTEAPSPKDTPLIMPDVSERKLGRWDFEGGGFVEIRASVGLDTDEALDMAETLIDLRRKELGKKRKSSDDVGDPASAKDRRCIHVRPAQ